MLKLKNVKMVGTNNELVQECVVADKSGKGSLIHQIQVHVFSSKYQLQFTTSGFTIKPLEDDLNIHLLEKSDKDVDDPTQAVISHDHHKNSSILELHAKLISNRLIPQTL